MLGYNYNKLILSPINLIRKKIENLEINHKETARKIVSLIPNQCPFARQINFFNLLIITIPPLCKINPFYDDLMILRFRALSFLCEIGEDISPYCN